MTVCPPFSFIKSLTTLGGAFSSELPPGTVSDGGHKGGTLTDKLLHFGVVVGRHGGLTANYGSGWFYSASSGDRVMIDPKIQGAYLSQPGSLLLYLGLTKLIISGVLLQTRSISASP